MKKIIIAIILSMSFTFGTVEYYRFEVSNEMNNYSLFKVHGSPFMVELEYCYRSAFRQGVLVKFDTSDERNNTLTFDDDGKTYRIIKVWR